MAEKKKPNQLAVLGGVLLVLLLLVVFVADPFGLFRPSDEEQAEKQGLNKPLCSFTRQNITAFEIKPAHEGPFKLTHDTSANEWFVELGEKRYRADAERVGKLLDQLPGLRAESVATSKKESYSLYEVGPETAIGLQVFTGAATPEAVFSVGKATDNYQGCYLRLGDDPVVYRSSANIKSLVGFTGADYRTRSPWKFEPSAATALTIRPPQAGAAAVTLTKKGEYWQYADGKNANQNLIKETLKKLSEATINDYVDSPDLAVAKLAAEPGLVVKTNTAEYKLFTGATEASTLYVKDQDGWVYKTSEYSMRFYTQDLALDKLAVDDTKQDEQAADGKPATPGAPSPAPAPGTPSPAPGAPAPPPATPPPAAPK